MRVTQRIFVALGCALVRVAAWLTPCNARDMSQPNSCHALRQAAHVSTRRTQGTCMSWAAPELDWLLLPWAGDFDSDCVHVLGISTEKPAIANTPPRDSRRLVEYVRRRRSSGSFDNVKELVGSTPPPGQVGQLSFSGSFGKVIAAAVPRRVAEKLQAGGASSSSQS